MTGGVILVEHDADGQAHVSQTGDHLGRKGLGCGGGVGLKKGMGGELQPGWMSAHLGYRPAARRM